MKIFIIFLALMLTQPTYATTDVSKEVFYTLAETLYPNKKPNDIKAPLTIEVTELNCERGHKTECKGSFKIADKVENKKIKNSAKLFKLLDESRAIAQKQIGIGGTFYGTNKLVCVYDDKNLAYECTSDVSVKRYAVHFCFACALQK